MIGNYAAEPDFLDNDAQEIIEMFKEKMKKIIYCFISGVVCIILSFLLAQSFFTDVKIDDVEGIYFIASGKLLITLLFLLFLAFFYLWHKYIKLSDKIIKRIIIVMIIVNFLFILGSQNMPRGDQYRILKTASELVQGDYNRFECGKYLYMCPHQNGLVLFCYFLCKFLGEYNFLAFQMVNLLAVSFTYYLLYHYLEKYTENSRKDEIIVGIMLFFPIILYTNYVYGILTGLMCACCAMLCQQMYFQKRDNRNLLLSVLFLALACMFKTNYVIFAIGILLLYFVDAWEKRKSIMGIAGIIIALLLMNSIVSRSLSVITDGASDEVGGGIPTIAYLVMGISNRDGYGWFNSYNWAVYTDNDYNYAQTQKACIEDLKSEIQYQLDNPKETVDFFHKKITSIWCEASFGAFYETRIDYKTVLQNHSHLYNDMFSYTGRWHRILGLFLEVYQIVVYLGVILYIVYSWKDYALLKLSGLIIFLGGFIFHIFWEAKSSYTFAYFVLLIPYAVIGLGKCFDKINIETVNTETDRKDKIGFRFLKGVVPFLACFALLVISSSVLLISKDDEKWSLFTAERRFIDEGYYYLQSKSADEICQIEGNDKFFLNLDISYVWKYELADAHKEKRLAVVDGELRMISDDEAEADDMNVDCPEWRFERVGGAYCIRWWMDMNKVITYDSENGTAFLSDYEAGNPRQLWELRR